MSRTQSTILHRLSSKNDGRLLHEFVIILKLFQQAYCSSTLMYELKIHCKLTYYFSYITLLNFVYDTKMEENSDEET